MIKKINKGCTLLVEGPTRISLIDGKIDVFGKIFHVEEGLNSTETKSLDDKNVIIIPSAQSYPLFALENSSLDVYTNRKENLTLIEENSIPQEWIEVKDSLIKDFKQDSHTPLKIMVLGISSGKTALIKYLANNFFREGLKGGYLDSDLGQQTIYIPTMLAIGTIEDNIVSSHNINSEKTEFIGSTFPKGDYKFLVSVYSRKLIEEYLIRNKGTDYILCDTDGWCKTEAGTLYKNIFIKTVDPDVLIVFYDESIEELKEITANAKSRKDRKIFLIKEKNTYFYNREKEQRRFVRQSQFSKKFEAFRKISIPLNDMKFIKTEFDIEENQVIEKEININELVNLPYHYVIIGLITENSELIEIGLLFTINIQKNYILLFSNLTYKQQLKIKKILLGSLRLSTKGNHQGYLYL